MINLDPTYWHNVGKATLTYLPEDEKNAFIYWVANNENILKVYEASPGNALRMWHDSADRFALIGSLLDGKV